MSTSEPPTEPPRVKITIAVWKRAPLAWTLFLVGRMLSERGDALAKVGQRLMAKALRLLSAHIDPNQLTGGSHD